MDIFYYIMFLVTYRCMKPGVIWEMDFEEMAEFDREMRSDSSSVEGSLPVRFDEVALSAFSSHRASSPFSSRKFDLLRNDSRVI